MTAVRTPTLWRAFASYGIWAVCFTVLYTVHALGCTWMGTPGGGGQLLSSVSGAGLTLLLAVIWLLFVFGLLILTVRTGFRVRALQAFPIARHRSLRFMLVLTLVTDFSAVVITVISGLPIILSPACI